MRRTLGILILAAVPVMAAELTADQWRQDLGILATELPLRHKNLFFQLSKQEFERRVQELDASIPKLSDLEIRAALVRLLASVGNAHTTIDAFQNTPEFPLLLYSFPEGVYVTAAPLEHPEAFGARVLSIGGTDIDEVKRKLLPYVAQENDIATLLHIPGLLRSAAPLKAAGVIRETDKAEFKLERDGSTFTLVLEATREAKLRSGPSAGNPPLYRRRRGSDYWAEYLTDGKIMYVQYNACRNMKHLTFADFTNEVMKIADARPVDKWVVDLRFNGGGNSLVVKPLIRALKARPNARVFGLVSRHTFSSGFMAALDLRNNCRAVLVGEAMGQRPNSYGDIRPLKLPNSGLTAWYCTKYFRLVHGDPPALDPDVAVPITAADYFGNRDPVLDYVLAQAER